MLGEAASRALRNSTPDPSFGGPEFFLRRYGSRGRPECSGDRSRERERVVPGAGTGTRRERERERAGSGNGNVPEKERRGGDRSGDRPAGAEGRRGTSAGSNRKRCRTSPQGLNSGQTMPPSRMLTRNTLRQLPPPLRRDATPSAHRPAALHHPSLHTSANFPSPAPPRGLFLPRSARSCSLPEGPKRPPAGPGTGSHRPNTHNRPIARTRTKKERHPLPDAAPWNGCAASTRGRRPYRPLRAGRRTRPAYWPQSSPL